MGTERPLSDDARYPDLPPHGRELLSRLREHPRAPRFNRQLGDHLLPADRDDLRAFEAELLSAQRGWTAEAPPRWLEPFFAECIAGVPLYRRLAQAANARSFFEQPPCSRAEFAAEPWLFVPDNQPLDRMIVYDTSGTTGHALKIPSHPRVPVRYIPILRAALRARGADWRGGAGRVSVLMVCWQQTTFTFAAAASALDWAGNVKINLNPAEWRAPEDRTAYLAACAPEILSGDPLAFAALLDLLNAAPPGDPVHAALRPSALISSAQALPPALRRRLENRFRCPVLNVYSLTEAGPIAAERDNEPGVYEPLQHRLFIEILRPDGSPAAVGEQGEIVVSGGFNPFVPLLRYRTGDRAALCFNGTQPLLCELEGRAPVLFRSSSGAPVNTIDVTAVLRDLDLPQFRLHQHADGSLRAYVPANSSAALEQAVTQRLHQLFGPAHPVVFEPLDPLAIPQGKPAQYSAEPPAGSPAP